MKKLILGILFTIAFVGCGKNEVDNELYTSYEYKQNLVKRVWADDGSHSEEASREYWNFLERLSKEKGSKSEKEIESWKKAMVNRFNYVTNLKEKERSVKVKRLTADEWKEIQEYKNSLAVPLNPDL